MAPKKPKGPEPVDARITGGPLDGRRTRLAHDTPDLIVLNMGRDLYRRTGRDTWAWDGPKTHAVEPPPLPPPPAPAIALPFIDNPPPAPTPPPQVEALALF